MTAADADWFEGRTTVFDGLVPFFPADWKVSFAPPSHEVDPFIVECLTCGNIVTLREGDDPIPFGDERLCEHMGRHPYHPETRP